MPRRVVMCRTVPLLWAFLLAVPVACCARSRADEPARPPVRESAPEIYYMQDDAGRLVPVPGFRYRDFVDLLRAREGLPGLPEAPAAVLENIAVTADLSGPPEEDVAGGDVASTCAVAVELTIRQARSGWVSLPLALDGLLLTTAPQHDGPGRTLLTAAGNAAVPAEGGASTAGYRLWLFEAGGGGNVDSRHVVRLRGRIAVDASAAHEAFDLDLPRSIASSVEIKTPRRDPVVSVRPQSLPPRVTAADGGGSVITLIGLSGPAKIRLGDRRVEEGLPGAVAAAGASAVPQAVVESLLRIDGRVAVTEASLRLDNVPATSDTIRVALPPRSTLRSVRAASTLVRMEGTEAQPVAVIRIDRAVEGRSLVELETERPIDPTGREAFEPLGFTVEGIPLWRQWGRVSILVDGDWQVEWDDAGGSRRIDPPAAARRPGFVAAFAYDAQPAQLPLRVRPRGSRVVIEPEYRYDVAATRVSLDARLRVSVRGAPASRIVVVLGDWDVDEVGPSSVVDSAAVSTEGGRLVIPFVQPLSGDAVVEIRGGVSLEPGVNRLGWRIPQPQADLVGPASIIIGSQSDIELLPDVDAVQGLVRQVTPTTLRSETDSATLAYRLDGSEGSFAATRRFLPRRVDAAISAQADIGASTMLVRQTIRFDVAHVPLEFVTLDVPDAVARLSTLEVRQNGQLLNPVPGGSFDGDLMPAPPDGESPAEDAATTAAEESAPSVRMQVMLAVPLLGAGEVTVQYELATPSVPPETTVAEDVPLVLPAAARIGRQSITLSADETLSVDVRGNNWKRDVAAPSSAAGASRTWTTGRPQAGVPLALSAQQRSTSGETEVEASWLQTLLIGDRRQDIWAYAITTTAERLSLTLPRGLASAAPGAEAEIEVRLDGERQPAAVRADGRIVVELQPRVGGSRLLEIRCMRPQPPLLGTGAGMPCIVELEPPSFAPGALQRRFYWELLLAPGHHAVWRTGQWTSQQRWQWDDIGLHQVPIVTRGALAAWLGAVLGEAVSDSRWLSGGLPAAGPRAVFSGVGSPGAARIVVVPTWLLVLVVSGPVLAVGLLGVYQPWMRRIPIVLTLAATASLAATMVPDLAPLVALAAIPGIALTAMAAGLRAWLRRDDAERARKIQATPSASSLTHFAPQPSLIIRPSLARAEREITAAGRDLP